MKALVLGATGFIGGSIARAAVESGWPVRGLRRNTGSVGDVGDLPIEWLQGDLNDTDSLHSAMQGSDIVFNSAAYYPRKGETHQVDIHVQNAVNEIERVIAAFKNSGAKRLIYTSSLTTIGHPPQGSNRLADERDYYHPGDLAKSAYYECKIAMEAKVESAAREGLNAVILNPTAVFGPGDVHLTMGALLIAAAKGQLIFWLPGTVNVVDVRDVAKAHILAAQAGKQGERYILGGHNYSIKETIEIVADAAQVRPPFFEIPLALIDLLVLLGDLVPALPLPANHMRAIRQWQGLNTHKSINDLGIIYRPFRQTIKDGLDWFREHGFL
jgi:dihydroflavonol-4-reductase